MSQFGRHKLKTATVLPTRPDLGLLLSNFNCHFGIYFSEADFFRPYFFPLIVHSLSNKYPIFLTFLDGWEKGGGGLLFLTKNLEVEEMEHFYEGLSSLNFYFIIARKQIRH